jgi:hypothetical protein
MAICPRWSALPMMVGSSPSPTHELVNYRYANGRFVVDKVLDCAVLLSGTGNQQVKVRIEREGSK